MWRAVRFGSKLQRISHRSKHALHSKTDQFLDATPAAPISGILIDRARNLQVEHARLSQQSDSIYDAAAARKAGALSKIAATYKAWEAARESIQETQQMINDPSTDTELRSLASEELAQLTTSLHHQSQTLKAALVPSHPFSHLPCLLEIRPGAGGDEASIFAGDLLRMYEAYCKRHKLRHSVLQLETAIVSGEDRILEAVLEIPNPGSYDRLRCEAGVHRVQRVPATEAKGRTHTSAASVMVLPSFSAKDDGVDGEHNFDDPESDYYVNPNDVRTDTMRASGAGGQHVNMTDSAVRLTHVPTSTVVSMQTSRSQHKNRENAWNLLRSRLAQQRREAREEERANLRASIIGVGKMGRGDKVRTYNWGQQRVTDHRSGLTVNRLSDVLDGGESLDEVMQSVGEWLQERDLVTMIADEEAEQKVKQKRK